MPCPNEALCFLIHKERETLHYVSGQDQNVIRKEEESAIVHQK